MLKPKLTNLSAFVDKPKPVIIKSKRQIQYDVNYYMNIALFLIIITGFLVLYFRHKYKKERELEAKQTLMKFDDFMNDHIIHSMLNGQNNNVSY